MKQFICTFQNIVVLVQAINEQRARRLFITNEYGDINPLSWVIKEIKPISGEGVIIKSLL